MLFIYPSIVHTEEYGYWLEFPDLPGAQTQADTMNELIVNAQEALEGYLLTVLEDGDELNSPTDLKDFNTEQPILIVTVDIDLAKNTKSVKKTLTIPQWLNQKATENHVNFSQVLQEALVQQLHFK